MTFSTEIQKYLINKKTVKNVFSHPEILPETKGIYIYTVPDKDVDIEFLDTTTAKETYNGKSLIFSKDKLTDKFNKGDKKVLYIGSTPSKNIKERTMLRAQYSKEKNKNIGTRGGRALWQIKDWENMGLNFYYYETENCTQLETKLLTMYKEEYGVYPVANWRS